MRDFASRQLQYCRDTQAEWACLELAPVDTGAVIFCLHTCPPWLVLTIIYFRSVIKTSLSELVLNKCLFSHFLPGLGFVVIDHVLHCVSGVPQSRHPVTVPTLFRLFGVSSLPPKTVSFCVSYCLRLQERILVSDIEDYLIPTGWWVGSHFPRGQGSVATSLFLGVCWVRSAPRDLTLYPDFLFLFFFQMAGALRGRVRTIALLLLDLGMDPSPDHPISVEIRCDCLAVLPRNQVLPLSVTTGFCLLSTLFAHAQGSRV